MKSEWRVALVLVFIAASASACSKPSPPEDTCVMPDFTATAAPGTYMGQREQAAFCVRRAAFEMARKGGPLPPIAAAALARCAKEEADTLAALQKMGPVYDYQRQMIHDDLTHAAARAAVQARSIGCGKRPGAGRDTI